MFRRPLVILVLLAAGATCASTQPAARRSASETAPTDNLVPNPALPPRAYTDGLGIAVEIVPLKIPNGANPQALVRITGMPSYIAGITFLMTRVTLDRGEDYWFTEINGYDSQLIRSTPNFKDQIRVFMPRMDIRGGVALNHDPTASAAVDIDELLADHRSHIADGSIAKVAEFDLSYLKSGKDADLEVNRKLLRSSCDADVEVNMDWDSVTSRADFTLVHFCAMSLEAIAELCQLTDSTKKEVSGRLRRVDCRYQKEQEVSFDKDQGRLSVYSNMDALRTLDGAMSLIGQTMELRRTVLMSAHGLYMVLPLLQAKGGQMFAGLGTQLFEQYWGSASPGSRFSVWDGSVDVAVKKIEPGLWKAECRYGDVELREVSHEERDRVLGGSTFEPPLWKRMPFFLARDDRGIYYYVDRLDDRYGGLGYRVFKGPRGKLALTTMVDIVDDAQGKIFATTSGDLRLVLSGKKPIESRWLTGKKVRDLVILKDGTIRDFVYGELGVYKGEDLGTLCSFASLAADRK